MPYAVKIAYHPKAFDACCHWINESIQRRRRQNAWTWSGHGWHGMTGGVAAYYGFSTLEDATLFMMRWSGEGPESIVAYCAENDLL